jgi:hypothetical protein
VNDRCSTTLKCSASGLDCAEGDRACQEHARAQALEVVCDRPGDDGRHFVYCPPGGRSRDSGAVWILLVVASAIAIGGTAIAWHLLTRKPENR